MQHHSKSGFTLVELMIVVGIIGILMAMAIPNFLRVRLTTRKTICLNNLRQIEASVDRWIFDNGIEDGVIVSAGDEAEIYSYLRGGEPSCASGGTYTIAAVGTYPQVTCDIEGHSLVDGDSGGSSSQEAEPQPL